jgi:hypothetical protein
MAPGMQSSGDGEAIMPKSELYPSIAEHPVQNAPAPRKRMHLLMIALDAALVGCVILIVVELWK